MHENEQLAKLSRLTALIVIALNLGGCWTTDSASNGASSSASASALLLQGIPPASVAAGSSYSFQPTVSRSIDVVTFAIRRKPAWAHFDPSSGALTGTPADRNVGTTGNITIVASNGTSSASIGPFAIQVDAAGGSATLSWVGPTDNTNGTAVTDLAGYHIHYGTSESDLTQEIDVPSPTATTYVVGGLARGTYYFAISAYTVVNTESSESIVGSKTI